jgi:anion-transporting  ArsA/GET3 family ATPase
VKAGTDPISLVTRRRLVVCLGTGGVGKTTVAAALAVRAAQGGRRVLVITIDPARRLADALGVSQLDNEPRELSGEVLRELGASAGGSLSAMMIDMKRTFDDLVDRFAESPEMREQILGNQIYQHLSDTLAGSVEYAAMAKVLEMYERKDFDLIVVDTPPSQHALDFLDAPQRIVEFLDSRLVKTLINPALAAGRFGFRVFHRATERILALMERVTGLTFLEDISEFLLIFADMSDRFQSRARDVRALLTGSQAGFVLVAGATPEAAMNGELFLEHLEKSEVPLVGVIVNRVRLWPSDGPSGAYTETAPVIADGPELRADVEALTRVLTEVGGPQTKPEATATAAVQVARRYASLVWQDARSTASLRGRARQSGLFYRAVPEFPRDVHDLSGLVQIGRHVFDDRPVASAQASETNAQETAAGH